jgi:hemin uptake protein HemP
MTEALERARRESDQRPKLDDPVDLDTRELFAGRTEIRIAHDNSIYRLRITRAGKLILNK